MTPSCILETVISCIAYYLQNRCNVVWYYNKFHVNTNIQYELYHLITLTRFKQKCKNFSELYFENIKTGVLIFFYTELFKAFV